MKNFRDFLAEQDYSESNLNEGTRAKDILIYQYKNGRYKGASEITGLLFTSKSIKKILGYYNSQSELGEHTLVNGVLDYSDGETVDGGVLTNKTEVSSTDFFMKPKDTKITFDLDEKQLVYYWDNTYGSFALKVQF